MTSRRLHLGLWSVLLLFGFLLTGAVIQERALESRAPERRAELEALVEQRRATIAELSGEVSDLSERLEEVRGEAGEGRETEALTRRVKDLQRLVGLVATQGPGVVVELRDSDRQPRTRDEVTDLRIQDVDIQLTVNALWRAGAEAIAVNGRRLVSTTAIRRAGRGILVNYRAISSPYRVTAIGDAEVLRESVLRSQLAERFEVWKEIYGLGFTVRAADSVVVPGLSGLRDLRFAEAAEPAS